MPPPPKPPYVEKLSGLISAGTVLINGDCGIFHPLSLSRGEWPSVFISVQSSISAPELTSDCFFEAALSIQHQVNHDEGDEEHSPIPCVHRRLLCPWMFPAPENFSFWSSEHEILPRGILGHPAFKNLLWDHQIPHLITLKQLASGMRANCSALSWKQGRQIVISRG